MKRNKPKGALQGFVVEAGGPLSPAAKKFIDEVLAKCGLSSSEVARDAAASKIVRAIGISADQAYIHDESCWRSSLWRISS